ncbi:MAG: Rieske 2Fe-2S domain-containing protein [Anaerolineales bacterium]|nr:Rieske 2Fe-2S domain-containing protein [Anaerolineales bacterium]
MSEKEADKSVPRRSFLGMAWFATLSLVAVQGLVAILKFINPVPTGGFGGFIYAGKIEDFAINSINRILAGRFYISRTDQGVIALWQKCTHLGCAVPWDESEKIFHCPCHGSTFNEVGEVLGGPAPRPLDYFPAEVSEDGIWVDTSDPRSRNHHDPSHMTQVQG